MQGIGEWLSLMVEHDLVLNLVSDQIFKKKRQISNYETSQQLILTNAPRNLFKLQNLLIYSLNFESNLLSINI
jgi:hypothetical protein